ncbi:hypothetical protein [Legionella maioricensis]|uniref:Transmembrane protein n=1 Tax=Legionella maioricensis TaxID=2896528 RepID=A0A9X2IB05_9GAMM|nr:hypothetical protein [Legionella maioricensis]MCL9684484.1 hypothetical protein [Legionella maioricensis]MCL9687922.1 hypothetical protein [Legionella maioricensis]
MFFFSHETGDDLLFTVRYMPKILTTTIKYGFYGALLGLGASYVFAESLNRYAEQNHDGVDLTDSYVANDEAFMKFSRNKHFNKRTPPISEFLPVYGAIVGAGAGALFSLSKVANDFSKQLNEDREMRRLNMV